jgi:hypothetical protein
LIGKEIPVSAMMKEIFEFEWHSPTRQHCSLWPMGKDRVHWSRHGPATVQLAGSRSSYSSDCMVRSSDCAGPRTVKSKMDCGPCGFLADNDLQTHEIIKTPEHTLCCPDRAGLW